MSEPTTVRVLAGGVTYEMDVSQFMLSEAIILQETTGEDINGLGERAKNGDLRALKGLLWLAQLRNVRTEQGLNTEKAARHAPYEDFDVNLVGATVEVIGVDPPLPTGTPPTPTPPGTSATARTPGARKRTSGSARSRSTSTSAPGSSSS